ncbi:ankyrin repeat and SAM domain-containing protein 4B-like [Dysidea avara]|uniref:ankyrin repeat and SAM domain-containing protein 4B-like n=1 Tax=Dysidea avara TaxID=196820 RepID=UPI00333407CA
MQNVCFQSNNLLTPGPRSGFSYSTAQTPYILELSLTTFTITLTPLHLEVTFTELTEQRLPLRVINAPQGSLLQGGDLPLHIASSNGHNEVVEVLIKAGSDIYYTNNKARTAIQEAIDCERWNIVHYFVKEVKMDIKNLDQITQIKIRKKLKEMKPTHRRFHGQQTDEYDSDQSSGAHSGTSSGYESDYTDGKKFSNLVAVLKNIVLSRLNLNILKFIMNSNVFN